MAPFLYLTHISHFNQLRSTHVKHILLLRLVVTRYFKHFAASI